MIYQTIASDRGSLSISAACKLFGISRDAYYHYLKNNKPSKSDTLLRHEIEKIILEFPGYGYRRVTKELKKRDFHINHKRVLRIMNQNSLTAQLKRAFRPMTTDSNHFLPTYPNLTKNLIVTDINQLWVADITYIHLTEEFVYLAVILDAFSRKVVGWNLARHISQELALKALEQALLNRDFIEGLIHHSDRGVQYASGAYTNLLKKNGIRISMSAKGNPYENAQAESFFKTLKWEEVYLNEYRDYFEAKANIGRFIEEVYNKKRLHSSIGYLSPTDFEREMLIKVL